MASYIPSTPEERREMLAAIGMRSEEDLYAAVPESVRVSGLDLPEGKSEMEAAAETEALAAKNVRFASCFRGAGAYRHYIPAIVKTVVSKEEFVTAYTPYQAEISQGVLQSIFEYQTQICELTGMDVSNASVYDGAVAAAEAVLMCEDRKKTGVLVSGAVDPQILSVVRTYCESRRVALTVLPVSDLATDPEAVKAALTDGIASVLFQSPNYYGVIEDAEAIVSAAHARGAKAVVSPGECGVDVAVGEGQPLGMPAAFGGPYLGFMACTQAMVRRLPGRIVGETKDARGRRCFVLTLQAREQHIRREKASSNICSNEALCAMTAAVYLAAVGPAGLRTVAESCFRNAHYLADELEKLGFFRPYAGPFFHEFVTTCPVDPRALEEALSRRNILSGLPIEGGMLWCATELNDKADVDRLIHVLKEVL